MEWKFASQAPISGVKALSTTPMASEGIMSSVLDFAKSPVGIASIVGAGGLAALGEEEEETTKKEERPFPKGTPRLGMGMVDGKSYNLNNKEERDEYFRRVRAKQGFEDDVGIMTAVVVERSTDQGLVQVILYQQDYQMVSLY